jgi:hypothetical protein
VFIMKMSLVNAGESVIITASMFPALTKI